MLTSQGREKFGNQFNSLPESVKDAIVALHPAALSIVANDLTLVQISPGTLQYKYNRFSLDDDGVRSGLCVVASRFNHACVPNCGRFFIPDHELMIIYISKPI